jgi:hypothetical protein
MNTFASIVFARLLSRLKVPLPLQFLNVRASEEAVAVAP